jgi:5-methylcytosine-specific restriction endonuclease McrA
MAKLDYYQKNREKVLARASTRYHSMTPEERIEHNRKRRERHARQPEVRNRIERLRGQIDSRNGGFTKKRRRKLKKIFSYICFYCGVDGADTIDHLTPISRGGSNEISNLVPACMTCNTSKRNKTYGEYLEWRNVQP